MPTAVRNAFAAASLALAATASLSQGISDDVVRIGVMTDMSGPLSSASGMGSVRAAQMAAADFGGKVLGKPVEIIYADHQNKSDLGAAKAREWFDQGKVDMVLNLVNSSVALAVQRLGAEKKRITISTGGGTVALTQQDCSPYGISYAYDTYSLSNGTASATVGDGQKNWYFITADYAFGLSLEHDARAVVEKMGGKVIGSVKHPLNAADFSSFVLQAQAAHPEVIAMADGAGDFANAVKAIREFGVVKDGKPLVVGLLVLVTDVKSIGLPTVQGMQYTDPWYWDYDDRTRAFAKRFMAVQNAAPTFAQAADYSAVIQYLTAIRTAGTDDPDAVMKVLRSTRYDDMFLRNGYLRPDGRMIHDMYLMQVKTPAESKGAWDLATVKKIIRGDDAFMPLESSKCPLVKR